MAGNVISGALGGALGGLVMKAMVEVLDPASFGLSAETDARTAHAIWQKAGRPNLSEKQAKHVGALMHYGFAVAAGAAYGAWAGKRSGQGLRRGALFGAGLWLLGDEIAVALSGLEDPRRAPMRSHVSALGAHVAYGLVCEFSIAP